MNFLSKFLPSENAFATGDKNEFIAQFGGQGFDPRPTVAAILGSCGQPLQEFAQALDKRFTEFLQSAPWWRRGDDDGNDGDQNDNSAANNIDHLTKNLLFRLQDKSLAEAIGRSAGVLTTILHSTEVWWNFPSVLSWPFICWGHAVVYCNYAGAGTPVLATGHSQGEFPACAIALSSNLEELTENFFTVMCMALVIGSAYTPHWRSFVVSDDVRATWEKKTKEFQYEETRFHNVVEFSAVGPMVSFLLVPFVHIDALVRYTNTKLPRDRQLVMGLRNGPLAGTVCGHPDSVAQIHVYAQTLRQLKMEWQRVFLGFVLTDVPYHFDLAPLANIVPEVLARWKACNLKLRGTPQFNVISCGDGTDFPLDALDSYDDEAALMYKLCRAVSLQPVDWSRVCVSIENFATQDGNTKKVIDFGFGGQKGIGGLVIWQTSTAVFVFAPELFELENTQRTMNVGGGEIPEAVKQRVYQDIHEALEAPVGEGGDSWANAKLLKANSTQS